MTMSNEERIARVEAGYEHLATKADVSDVRAELADTRADLKSDIGTAQADTTRRIDPAVLGDHRHRRRAAGRCRRRSYPGHAGVTPVWTMIRKIG